MPSEVTVKTIEWDQRFFWESMVISISKAQVLYHMGQ